MPPREWRQALEGLKGFITNLDAPTPDYVLGAHHQLWQIEKSFLMYKSDLRARPNYHHKPDSIEAHPTIVMVALAPPENTPKYSHVTVMPVI